jgi:prolyl 4-hydroxylase
VLSAIINVDQDLDEPWPLEVYGHDGKAVNVTMEPGDMVLYESHSIIHGRPFPLKGRFMANLFIHFEPIGPLSDVGSREESIEQRTGLPPYIIPGSTAAEEWAETYPESRRPPKTSFIEGSSYAHFAAKEGAVDQLAMEIEKERNVIHKTDIDGYTPLHLGVKNGHLNVVQLLIDTGADKDARTANAHNATSLWWAKVMHDKDHPVVQYLLQIGAKDVGPDL